MDTQQKINPYDSALLRRCREAVWEVTPSATVILYGSRARGDATPESDYDLLVLVRNRQPVGLKIGLAIACTPLSLNAAKY